jgi:hypothetical protein
MSWSSEAPNGFGALVTFSTLGFVSFPGGMASLYLLEKDKKFSASGFMATFLIITLVLGAVIFTQEFGILAECEQSYTCWLGFGTFS